MSKMYILMEEYKQGFANLLFQKGLEDAIIFNNINDFKNELILSTNDFSIVIIEQGKGKLTSAKSVLDVEDIVGLCKENSRGVKIFTTNKRIFAKLIKTYPILEIKDYISLTKVVERI